MIGLGTIVNTIVVILGGIIGINIKRGLSDSLQNSLIKALGISTMFIGLSGALAGLLVVKDGGLSTQGTILMIISLVVGTFIGELIKIENRLESLGEFIKSKVKKSEDSKFVEGFVSASLIMCVGTMSILGSLNDGLTGDASMLYAKSILDGVVAMIFSSTLGIGVIFSGITILVYQGTITLLATFIEPLLSDMLIQNMSYIGSILIFAIGINLTFNQKIKTGNMLPAILIPIVYEIILNIF